MLSHNEPEHQFRFFFCKYQTLMPVIFGHTPAGTSTKTVVHYAQEIHESMQR